MKKLICFLLCLLSACPCAFAEKYMSPPYWQEVKQTIALPQYLMTDVYVEYTYPKTKNENVNAQLRQCIDEMGERAKPFIPLRVPSLMPTYLDVGATIFHTGEKWMSFLTIARIAAEREQTYVDFDAQVYDIETGAKITLSDLFEDDSPIWEMLTSETERQLQGYFSTVEADAEKVQALSSKEALKDTPFVLTPAKLSFYFRADALYPGKNTLMHVDFYYSSIRTLMTAQGQTITDNSRYKLIALTFDDGGNRGTSMRVMNVLRQYGANATFFVVGNRINNNHDVLCRQHDAGFAVQSHNYEHVYNVSGTAKVKSWREKFDRALDAVIGQTSTYMRAPGGLNNGFINAQVGLPLIHWSAMSGDADNSDYEGIANAVIGNAKDGCVMLLHDINPKSPVYTEIFMPILQQQGYLFVTVDELFSHYGMELLPNTVYYGCEAYAQNHAE